MRQAVSIVNGEALRQAVRIFIGNPCGRRKGGGRGGGGGGSGGGATDFLVATVSGKEM